LFPANLKLVLILRCSTFRHWLRPIGEQLYCAEHFLAMGILGTSYHKWTPAYCAYLGFTPKL